MWVLFPEKKKKNKEIKIICWEKVFGPTLQFKPGLILQKNHTRGPGVDLLPTHTEREIDGS